MELKIGLNFKGIYIVESLIRSTVDAFNAVIYISWKTSQEGNAQAHRPLFCVRSLDMLASHVTR